MTMMIHTMQKIDPETLRDCRTGPVHVQITAEATKTPHKNHFYGTILEARLCGFPTYDIESPRERARHCIVHLDLSSFGIFDDALVL
jgi:hypothetical protein